MSSQLDHRQINATVSSLADAKIVNLDASLKSLINPVAEALGKSGVGSEVAFHVLCCNEYFLVTGLQGSNVLDAERLAETIRAAVGRQQNT